MDDETKAKMHCSQVGIQGYLRGAREVVYWPGMNKDIKECEARYVQKIIHVVDLYNLNCTEFSHSSLSFKCL